MGSRRSFHRGLALLVAAAFFMENLDGTIIQTAAPAMADDLGVAPAEISIAMVSYLMAVAMFIPASGWLSDRFGTRRVFLFAVVLFTLASFACAIAPTLDVLTAARAIQGIGGALMIPVGRLAVLRTTSTADLLEAIAYLTWPALLAPVLAPFIGGLFADTIGWPWIFYINLPIGVAIFTAGLVLVPQEVLGTEGSFDWSGFVAVASALALVTVGSELVSAASGFGVLLGAAAIIFAGLIAVFGIRRMHLTVHPLFDWSALRIHTFRVGNISGSVYRLMITGAPFLFTLLFQLSFGWSAVTAGLVVMSIFIGNVAIKPATTYLIRRWGFRRVLIWANVCSMLIFLAFVMIRESTPIAVIVLLLAASGVFRSIGFSAYNTMQFVDILPANINGANTLSATIQQVATALGITVVALFVRIGSSLSDALFTETDLGYSVAFLFSALLMLIPLGGSFSLDREAGSAATRPEPVTG